MFNLTRQERMAVLFVAGLLILGAGIGILIKHDPAWTKAGRIEDANPVSLRVNINSAPEDELIKVPGIGPVTAASIVSYRLANGPFQNLDELDRVKGIGPSRLSGLKQYLVLE